MAKKSSVEKNQHRRELVAKQAAKRAELKAIIKQKDIDDGDRFEAVLKLAELPRNGSKVRIRNRCEMTGRPRAYYRKLGLSRIALRDLASTGQIPGMVKSSW
ncbi:MAG TPA: 30S ribosomal protein S14 [Geminicoccus sp.]|uniref:30S ribosomal protein S14 n=1 Tax=Geminicoccus sp. TaxID=2024832 RepID=UPI002CAEC539|nr:30S ribosomal protein S14 [Geminicoccus sp.]HWL68617.1 30S ribosomal protein S14 [Geminicoccus sp.]